MADGSISVIGMYFDVATNGLTAENDWYLVTARHQCTGVGVVNIGDIGIDGGRSCKLLLFSVQQVNLKLEGGGFLATEQGLSLIHI